MRRLETCTGRTAALMVLCIAVLLALATGCTRQRPGQGVAQLPVDEVSASDPADEEELAWQIAFINVQPLTYPREARNHFLVGPDFTAELTFSAPVDEGLFERALHRGLDDADGDPVLTWENDRAVLFDLRGCNGRVRIDMQPLARKAGRERSLPLVIDCGPPRDVYHWSADRGTEVVGAVPAGLQPSTTHSGRSSVFYHRMRSADGGSDMGVWLADFLNRATRSLAVHYLGTELHTGYLEGASLVVSTGGEDLQLFGSNGVRVRQFDPQDLGLVVGMVVDDLRGRVAVFEGLLDETGRSGETRLRVLDRGLTELRSIEGVGRLSRLSGQWRTVDAVWLDQDTIAFIHWDNRFFGVVAIADVSTRTITRTAIVADELAGALADGRFVVRRQAGGRAGCWRAEDSSGTHVTTLCERLPGPRRASVSPDGNLVALELPDTQQVVVWNRVSGERRKTGVGELAAWTPTGELVWVSEPQPFVAADEDRR